MKKMTRRYKKHKEINEKKKFEKNKKHNLEV